MQRKPDGRISAVEWLIIGVTGAIVLVIVSIQVLPSIWAWTNNPTNASGVEALTAVLQVAGTLILLILTWHAIDSSRRVAKESQQQSARLAETARRESAREAKRVRSHADRVASEQRRQNLLSTLPVIVFQKARLTYSAFERIDFTVSNVGVGAALHVGIRIESRVLPYALYQEGEVLNLSPGASSEVTLMLSSDIDSPQIAIDQQWKNALGWMPFVEITAVYKDVRGNSWVQSDMLSWNPDVGKLGFTDPSHPLGE